MSTEQVKLGLPEKTLPAAQAWIDAHPTLHQPYISSIDSETNELIWTNQAGEVITRNVKRERSQISRFMDDLFIYEPEHYALISRLASEIAPMNSNNRVSVNVPALREVTHIYPLLEMYTSQINNTGDLLDPDVYEINVLVNRAEGEPDDGTSAEVERFKKDAKARGQKVNINCIDIVFTPPFNTVGNARKILTDLTLLRSIQRNTQDMPLYIESEDADLENIDPKTVFNVIKKLDANPELDAVLGIQDRLPEKLMENDYLLLYRRMADFRKSIAARPKYRIDNHPDGNFMWNRNFTGGWNTAYSAEAYTLTGGYEATMTEMEDLMIGLRLSMARGKDGLPNTAVIGKVPTRTDSSPRRYIYALALDVNTKDLSYADPVMNRVIREETLDELLEKIDYISRISPENLSHFQTMVNRHYAFIKRVTPNPEEARKAMELLMWFSGFKKPNPEANENGDYEFTQDDKVLITDITNIALVLQDYRDRHTAPREKGQRTGHRSTLSSITKAA